MKKWRLAPGASVIRAAAGRVATVPCRQHLTRIGASGNSGRSSRGRAGRAVGASQAGPEGVSHFRPKWDKSDQDKGDTNAALMFLNGVCNTDCIFRRNAGGETVSRSKDPMLSPLAGIRFERC